MPNSLLTPLIRSVVVATVFCLLFPAGSFAATLKIGGTGGDLGTMRQLGEVFEKRHAGVTVDVLPSLGSGGGIKAVLAGAIDLAISSRPLKAKERGQGAQASPYTRTALVFATPRGNSETSVTTEQLIDIYSGAQRAWPDGTRIRIVLRPETDTDNTILKDSLPALAPALEEAANRPGIPVAFTDQEAADGIQNFSGGLGTSMLSIIYGEERQLKALALDGVTPSRESIADGAYPLTKTFYFVTGSDPGDTVAAFIAFARSEESRSILEKTGHVVIGEEDQ